MKNHKWWEIGSHILLEKYYKYFFYIGIKHY